MDHTLDDGTVPGWAIRCLVCGRSWRRGPRRSQCPGDAVGACLTEALLEQQAKEDSTALSSERSQRTASCSTATPKTLAVPMSAAIRSGRYPDQ